jgi:hypothetical protein
MRASKRSRRAIALRDPRAQEMWQSGASLVEIAKALGMPLSARRSSFYFGTIDPTPQPLGCPPFAGRAGETAEMRAYRRFPIKEHKAGGKS